MTIGSNTLGNTKSPNVTLVIMNKNDLEGARQVIPKIERSLFSEVFVMDGGSTDGSLEYFHEQGLTVNVLESGGRGGAFRYATEHARGEFVVFFSTDGEEDPADLKQFVRLFGEGADMVIASRTMPGAQHKAGEHWYWLHRLVFLRFITTLINLLFGTRLYDCWNGYRGFRVAALKNVKTDAKNFLIEAQQTIRFHKAGYCIREFPTHEGQRIGGASGNPIFASGWGHLVMIVQEKFFG